MLRLRESCQGWFQSREGEIQIFDQSLLVERLAQKADRPGLQHSRTRSLVRKGRHEDYRGAIALSDQTALQLDPAQSGHLHVGDHASRVIDPSRLQKLLSRRK